MKRLLLLSCLFIPFALFAQNAQPYGTHDAKLTLGMFDFKPGPGATMTIDDVYFGLADGVGYMGAPVHLPAGAKITSVTVDDCHDPTATGGGALTIGFYSIPSEGGKSLVGQFSNAGIVPRCTAYTSTGMNTLVFGDSIYQVEVYGNTYDPTASLRSFRIGYTLQVSPPPAVASFTDVPTTHPFFRYIEALKASGITDGCAPAKFCPDANVTRSQLAKFLSVALGLYWPN